MTNEDSLQIDTPENVAFGYQVAGIGSRFVAALVDTLLIVLLQFLINGLLILLYFNLGIDAEADSASSWIMAVLGVVAFVFLWGYYIFFEMLWNGQSPGKRAMKLRVIRTDGSPITLVESLVRNLVRIVDFLPAAYGFGVVTMFVNPQSRRLGDLAAGTLVVHESESASVQSLNVRPAAAYQRMSLRLVSAEGFPVERLTNPEVHLIEEFLQRRDDMPHRQQLAAQILIRLYQRVGLPIENVDRFEAEDKLIAILESLRKRDMGAPPQMNP
jgi:uncharacterized RDD family membrane protein YckC